MSVTRVIANRGGKSHTGEGWCRRGQGLQEGVDKAQKLLEVILVKKKGEVIASCPTRTIGSDNLKECAYQKSVLHLASDLLG